MVAPTVLLSGVAVDANANVGIDNSANSRIVKNNALCLTTLNLEILLIRKALNLTSLF